jgi:hypothetical protein
VNQHTGLSVAAAGPQIEVKVCNTSYECKVGSPLATDCECPGTQSDVVIARRGELPDRNLLSLKIFLSLSNPHVDLSKHPFILLLSCRVLQSIASYSSWRGSSRYSPMAWLFNAKIDLAYKTSTSVTNNDDISIDDGRTT